MGLFLDGGHTPKPEGLMPDQVTIRRAYPDDEGELARLAALDSRRLPGGDLLVGEVDGVLWAAVSISAGVAIADPFRASAGIVRLLEIRAAQLRAADGAGGRQSTRPRLLTARRQPTG